VAGSVPIAFFGVLLAGLDCGEGCTPERPGAGWAYHPDAWQWTALTIDSLAVPVAAVTTLFMVRGGHPRHAAVAAAITLAAAAAWGVLMIQTETRGPY
jgi:hypothetical protein